jgi:hypothetical protein
MNLPRNNKNDDSYRTLLKLKAVGFSAYGTTEQIIQAVKFLYNATDVEYIPDYPAGIIIRHNGIGGLYFNTDFIFNDSNSFVFSDGNQFAFQSLDTISENLLSIVLPAGVSITIETMP